MRAEQDRRLAVLVEPLERDVLDGVREFENEPDRVRVELGIVPVFADERPLIGLAGLLDWRSCGRLSAVVRSSFFVGAAGEQLLTLGERRWPVDRLVLVGLGPQAEFDEAQARALGARCVELATGLDADSVLFALPSISVERGLVEIAFEALLEALEARSIAHEQPQASADGSETSETSQVPEPSEVSEGSEASEGQPDKDVSAKPSSSADSSSAVSTDTPDREPAEAEADATDLPVDPSADAPAPVASDTRADPELADPIEPEPELADELREAQGIDPSTESATESATPTAGESTSEREPAHELHCWVVVDESVVARLRRVRSGPPRAARSGPSLYT